MQRAITLILAAAALSGLGANASPYQPTDLRRRAMPEIPGYDFAGCYTEANGIRALIGSNCFDDEMTVEKCAAAGSGFNYFGVEYGRECYCGDTLNAGSVEAQLSDCSFLCPGDTASNCGAGNRLSMYIRAYSYLGCYTEPDGARALAGEFTFDDDLTVAKCATFCRNQNSGYSYFGLEYYRECYCGYGLDPDAQTAPETDCGFPCAGDASEKCGGDWRLNVHQLGSATSCPSSFSTPSSSSSAPTPTVDISSYASEGCYTEASGIRALSGFAYYDDLMTIEKCAGVCSTRAYTWFGLEYCRECYCGNTINQGSEPTDDNDCSFSCSGNTTHNCGAGNRLNMYRFLSSTSSASSAASTSLSPSSSSASSVASTSSNASGSWAASEAISSTESSAAATSSAAVSSSAESSIITSAPVISSAAPARSAVSSNLESAPPACICTC